MIHRLKEPDPRVQKNHGEPQILHRCWNCKEDRVFNVSPAADGGIQKAEGIRQGWCSYCGYVNRLPELEDHHDKS